MTQVVIFNEAHGWHSAQLKTALGHCGIKTICANLAHCRINLELPHGIYIPGLGPELPSAAIVRGIAAGSFEQITFRLDILHTLTELGVPVFNSAAAIERTVDKARTSLLLRRSGVSTPPAWVCEDLEYAQLLSIRAEKAQQELVLKPLFGCQGQGIVRIRQASDLEGRTISGNLYYLQQFIPPIQRKLWQDWRVFVVDQHCIAAMIRRGRTWITNAAQGAECLPAALNRNLCDLACRAARAVAVDYAGLDLVQTPDGDFQVLEINSVPSWKALHQATGIDIAGAIAGSLLKRLQSPGMKESSW
jgi:tetrahydromethanopterin:alpha-L-glutamate ligase